MITYSPYYLIELRKRLGGKLKSLLGKQNVSLYREFANITFYPNQDNGFENYWSSNGRTAKRIANHKYFMYAQIDIPTYAWCYFGMWDTSSTGYDGNRTDEVYKNGNDMFAIIEPTTSKDDSVPTFQFGGTEKATIYKAVILDLTQAKIDTLTAEQIYNLLTLNGTDFTNLELLSAGYEIKLGSFNNLGKYNFVKLKDIADIRFDSAISRFRLVPTIQWKYTDSSVVGNIFTENLKTKNSGGATDKTIAIHLSSWIQIIDTSCSSVNDLLTKYGEQYIIYELQNSLGNKLDNYTAEQVYYMFFATLGMNKMYVPYGKRFESSDNIILGTKYGIVDLGDFTWGYNSNYKFFFATGTLGNWFKSVVKPSQLDNLLANGHCEEYELSTWIIMSYNKDLDKQFVIRTNGELNIRDLSFEGYNAIQNHLKGKYLIYELATPNGTDYNDLTAKEMYDVLCDNQIDILANGKTLNGVRSIVGKQNKLVDNSSITMSGVLMISNNSFNTSYTMPTGTEIGANLIANHKYFMCVKFDNILSNGNGVVFYNGSSTTGLNTQSNINVAEKVWCGIWQPTSNILLNEFHFYNDYSRPYINEFLGKPQSYLIIDLTEHNLSNLTAQEAYQYFKEHNLFKMTTTGIINIGGLKK